MSSDHHDDLAQERITSRISAAFAGLGLALPLLYVLSVGPAAKLSMMYPNTMGGLRMFYIPLIWLHDHTPLRAPLEWYVELWGAK